MNLIFQMVDFVVQIAQFIEQLRTIQFTFHQQQLFSGFQRRQLKVFSRH